MVFVAIGGGTVAPPWLRHWFILYLTAVVLPGGDLICESIPGAQDLTCKILSVKNPNHPQKMFQTL
jgi:hypothetical protein